MYGIMFLNVDEANHIYLSLTRFYMSILMISSMAILMIVIMSYMYTNKLLNRIILAINILLFIIALILLRTQTPVADIQYMNAMIPHHSSAIMTSKHAHIKDPEVKKLSDNIIKSQEREINEMKEILERLRKSN